MVTRKLFKTAFLERFFLRGMRKSKAEEFINLKQGSMIVKEYSLMFVKFSMYYTSLLTNNKNEMSRFLKGINEVLEEDFRVAILHDNMDLPMLMCHVHQVEESRKKKHTRTGNK